MKFTPKQLMKHTNISYDKEKSWKYVEEATYFCFGKYNLRKACDNSYYWSKQDIFYLNIDRLGNYRMVNYVAKSKTETKYFDYIEDALDLLEFKDGKWRLKLK